MCLLVGDKERTDERVFGRALDSSRSLLCAKVAGEASLICIRGHVDWQDLSAGTAGSSPLVPSIPKPAMYVNSNHFYFSNHSVYHFAQEYRDSGGRVLLLDRILSILVGCGASEVP